MLQFTYELVALSSTLAGYRALGFGAPILLLFLWHVVEGYVVRFVIVLCSCGWIGFFVFKAVTEADINYMLFPAMALGTGLFLHPFLEKLNDC